MSDLGGAAAGPGRVRGQWRRPATRRLTAMLGLLVALVGAGALVGPAPGAAAVGTAAPTVPAAGTRSYVAGPITATQPSGFSYPEAFLYDQQGRIVLLHGVNVVNKRAPYEVYPDPGKPWNFDRGDAARIAALGFNVVRLGILWQGIEPGTLGANNPAVCTRGAPHDPGQWNEAVARRYLARVARTVDLLASYHVYTLLDMHQDVYSQDFRGEGAPPWAVCTDGIAPTPLPGRWSNDYASKALGAAFANFWNNRVVGDLQGEYDRAWATVASYFAADPWVVGYDPINEPFTTALTPTPGSSIDVQLECFYTGLAHRGLIDGQPAACPPSDPAEGVVPTILAADPHHLIFREPTIFAERGLPNNVGAMPFPNLVLNFHVYCSFRSGVTGDPYDLSACLNEEDRSYLLRSAERPTLASVAQPHGLPIFMSEFGATRSIPLIEGVTRAADEAVVGWTYWSWKYYHDPTGSSLEALVNGRQRLEPTARALARTYPLAIAGSPLLIDFSPSSGAFLMHYTADPKVTAPTLIWVSRHYYYPHGYCATTSAGSIVSISGAPVLAVTNPRLPETVSVSIRAGPCRP